MLSGGAAVCLALWLAARPPSTPHPPTPHTHDNSILSLSLHFTFLVRLNTQATTQSPPARPPARPPLPLHPPPALTRQCECARVPRHRQPHQAVQPALVLLAVRRPAVVPALQAQGGGGKRGERRRWGERERGRWGEGEREKGREGGGGEMGRGGGKGEVGRWGGVQRRAAGTVHCGGGGPGVGGGVERCRGRYRLKRACRPASAPPNTVTHAFCVTPPAAQPRPPPPCRCSLINTHTHTHARIHTHIHTHTHTHTHAYTHTHARTHTHLHEVQQDDHLDDEEDAAAHTCSPACLCVCERGVGQGLRRGQEGEGAYASSGSSAGGSTRRPAAAEEGKGGEGVRGGVAEAHAASVPPCPPTRPGRPLPPLALFPNPTPSLSPLLVIHAPPLETPTHCTR